ncbi:MAG: AAA family ATPase, partial [bacterium]|nr:AAA family ATPase [bacterium]
AYCSKYLPAIPFPEKAMDLLDETMVYLKQTKDKALLSEHVARIVSEKTQIPVGEMEKEERQVLLNLENLIHERIINQEEAVQEVSTALRRARAQVTIRSGPMGTFLFLGPTGVGKTETAKALAQIYFGSEEKMIRLDMSEFQNVTDIPRLLGAPGEEGLLTTQIRKRPFSLILLDEIEKAHPNILNLFLQVLDEGHLTDGLGRKVDFKNSIIIATSNAGYQIILKVLREKTEWPKVKQMLLDYLFEEGLFRPEFINRFDAMVVFKPLTKENLLAIADLMLKKLKKNLKEKEIEFVITEPLKEKMVELGYDPTFGARQMRRVIQDKIENVLAFALLSGEIKRGYKIEIDPEDFRLKIIQ